MCARVLVVGKYPTEGEKIMELQDGTYFVNGDRLDPSFFTEGYWVAETDHNVNHIETYDELVSFARWVEDRYDVAHVGMWTDDDGNRVLDATHYVEDILEAIAIGRMWNQKAIWDIKHGHAIYLD
jgi:hypothetical protein